MTLETTLKELILPLPGLKILEVGKGNGTITALLAAHLAPIDGTIDLHEYTTHAPNFSYENVTIKTIDSTAKIPRTPTREYEWSVASFILHELARPKKFLETCYHALENSAGFVGIFHEGECDPEEIYSWFDEVGFVAPNRIDTDDGVFLLTAKKMHHWGRGL